MKEELERIRDDIKRIKQIKQELLQELREIETNRLISQAELMANKGE